VKDTHPAIIDAVHAMIPIRQGLTTDDDVVREVLPDEVGCSEFPASQVDISLLKSDATWDPGSPCGEEPHQTTPGEMRLDQGGAILEEDAPEDINGGMEAVPRHERSQIELIYVNPERADLLADGSTAEQSHHAMLDARIRGERLSQNGDEVGLSTTYLQFVYQVNHERHHSTYKTLCLTKTF